jgi:hypothetical protein
LHITMVSGQHVSGCGIDPVDAERIAEFEGEAERDSPLGSTLSSNDAHDESSYFLTFPYLSPAKEAARAERFLYEGRDQTTSAHAHQMLAGFVDRTDRVLQLDLSRFRSSLLDGAECTQKAGPKGRQVQSVDGGCVP